MKKTVILGMGNPILTDDRIGLLIARSLEKKIISENVDIKVQHYMIDNKIVDKRKAIIEILKKYFNHIQVYNEKKDKIEDEAIEMDSYGDGERLKDMIRKLR